jgi:DegV family protein with EDD domain
MRDSGCSMEKIEDWIIRNRKNVHHQFFSTDLKHFRRSGRMSGATATIATILNICPIMRLDDGGRIIAYDKVRGKRSAIKRTVDIMEQHIQNGRDYTGKCFISHSDCLADAQEMKALIEDRFPRISGGVQIWDIGTIIASHCGPGTVAVYFMGDERQPDIQP